MSRTRYKKYPLILVLTTCLFLFGINYDDIYAFSDHTIQRGATGEDVIELQARLQYIGFYDGRIDGVFGWSTYWAVRHYQDEFGMKVDGLVGAKMKESLERTTDYRKDFVHKALNEGRKFTHYGGVSPFEKQKGEQGSDDGQITAKQQERKQQQQATQQQKKEQQGRQQQAPTPDGPTDPPETPPADQARIQEGEEQATPEQQGEAGTVEQPAPGQPEQVPDEDATPEEIEQTQGEGEPVPAPETPETQDNEPTIEKVMNVPEGFSENDIQIMAQAVYGEARGEPYIGQVAIAAVIINRMNSPTFPNTASGVIFEPRAFTAVADGQIYMTPNETSRKAVLDAINGQDPSGGATYYFNPDTATNAWIWSRPQIKRIGKHIFCN